MAACGLLLMPDTKILIFMGKRIVNIDKQKMNSGRTVRHLALMAVCSVSIGIALLVSRIEPRCCVEWIAGLGSNSVFILLCLVIAAIPALALSMTRHNQKLSESRSDLKELFFDLQGFISGFMVFFAGVIIATVIQRIRLGMDIYPMYLEQSLSYIALLEKQHFAVYYLLVAVQVSIGSGLLSIMTVVIFKGSKNPHFALILPVLLLKLEDILMASLFGMGSGSFYNGSLYMLTFATLKYKISANVHSTRIFVSILVLIIVLAVSYLFRTLGISAGKRTGLKVVIEKLFICLLLFIQTFCVIRGVLKYVNDIGESINLSFISHVFDNVHFTFFFGLTILLFATSENSDQRTLKTCVRDILRNTLYSLLAFITVCISFIVLFAPNLSFERSWGRVIHTLSYEPPVQEYEFIATSNPVIEETYRSGEAMLKSFLLVILVSLMISLLFVLVRTLSNEIVATVVGVIPVLLVYSGNLFEELPWLYYLSPLSWFRLSLNENADSMFFVYPTFGFKISMVIVINAILLILNSLVYVCRIVKNKNVSKKLTKGKTGKALENA